jgi:hypothetical protein
MCCVCKPRSYNQEQAIRKEEKSSAEKAKWSQSNSAWHHYRRSYWNVCGNDGFWHIKRYRDTGANRVL